MIYFSQIDPVQGLSASADIFLKEGILGAVIVVLASALVFIYRELLKERQRNSDLQDKRLQDVKDFVDAYKQPLQEISTQNKGIYELLTNFFKQRGV